MDYFTMARLAELNDFTEFAKVAQLPADPNPRDVPMFTERKTPGPVRQQSRVEWESKGRYPR